MTAPVITVGPELSVARAARRMLERHLRWMPVVDARGRVVGVLTRSDLLAVFLRDDADIRAEIVDELLGGLLLGEGRIDVRVEGGVVTLTGRLETRADAWLAVRFVERIEGVVSVVDHLGYRVDERAADPVAGPLR
ncbi:BON domain-containing protein [Pseudonocardia bannensis]|uniref:CBS domain-containing protein n=1 Tax=Pseudonocardia bannensis TaxID=630973 RepID=A0A848DRC8_9PSEU|nr:BON domain-containing protein [Pseudonocardia bannensis]NMH95298.1 CBS domain-containing protein [Pseudonocardia bannensis]